MRKAGVSDCRHRFVSSAQPRSTMRSRHACAVRDAMQFRPRSAEIWMSSMWTLLSGVLCVLMVEQPMVAAGSVKKVAAPSVQQIQGDERVLHVLNRFTFGP